MVVELLRAHLARLHGACHGVRKVQVAAPLRSSSIISSDKKPARNQRNCTFHALSGRPVVLSSAGMQTVRWTIPGRLSRPKLS